MKMIKYIYFGLSHEYDHFLYCINNTTVFSSPRIFQCPNLFLKPFFRLANSDYFYKQSGKHNYSFWTKHLLSNKLRKSIGKDDELRFIFVGGEGAEFVKYGLHLYLKSRFEKCKIIFVLDGVIESFYRRFSFFDLDYIKKTFDLVITYNPIEANKYSLALDRFRVPNKNYFLNYSKKPVNDVFFVGYAKSRLEKLHDIFLKLSNLGLKCDFYICGVKEEDKKYPGIHYNEKLEYKVVAKKICGSKAILNLLDEGNSGLTLRDYECICLNKVLITNQNTIDFTPFYNKNMVVHLANFDDEIKRINNSSNQAWLLCDEYSPECYYVWLEDQIN